MTLTKKRVIYVATESTFATDPDSDGSDYVSVASLEVGEIKDGLELLDTNYYTGRPYPTAPIVGKDGWSFDFTVPLRGLATGAGDGTSPGSDDDLDILLTHIFGTQSTKTGEGVGSGSTTSALTLDTDNLSVQDLVPIYESGWSISPLRTQWALITVDNADATYSFAPTNDEAATTAAVQYGYKNYRFNPADSATLAFVYVQDDVEFTCLGGRVTSCSIVCDQAGGLWKMNVTVMGDTLDVDTTHASLPDVSIATPTPCKGVASPVWFNNTELSSCGAITIDLNLDAGEIKSTAGTNGRSGMEIRSAGPTVTVTPLFDEANFDLRRDGTQGRLMVQIGAGELSSGVLNTLCFHAEQAIAKEVSFADDSGKQRNSIQFQVTDKVNFSSGVASVFAQLSRA